MNKTDEKKDVSPESSALQAQMAHLYGEMIAIKKAVQALAKKDSEIWVDVLILDFTVFLCNHIFE